jgi:hypothetical protein
MSTNPPESATDALESATNALALVSSICWTLIHQPSSWINPGYHALISTAEMLTNLLSQLTFCAGLKEVLSAPTPPPIGWFLQLDPHIPKSSWGVYLMVLEKDGHEPCIYVGSSVDVTQGIWARLGQHLRGARDPSRVKQVKDEGYKIVHLTILAYMGIPTPPERTKSRALIRILEACFHYVFWSMWSKDVMYSFPINETWWSPASFQYRGLSSHNPLIEGIEVNDQLSEDQLIEMDRVRKEKEEKQQQKWFEQLRVHNAEVRADPELKRERLERQRPRTRARLQRVIASKIHHCSTCHISFTTASHLRVHNTTMSHKKLTNGLESPDDRYYCGPCDIYIFRRTSNIDRHNKSKRHLEKTQG